MADEAKWTSTARSYAFLYVFRDDWYGRFLHRAKFQMWPALKRLAVRDHPTQGTGSQAADSPAPEPKGGWHEETAT